jgi:hypothetical protein
LVITSLLLASLALLGLTLDAAAGPGRRDKMDRHLRERTSRAADATPFKVIVTLKPGAKRHFVKAMKASGLKIDADFTLTEAFAAQLPAGLLRALENDPDVEAISTDAPVTAMTTVGTVYTVTTTNNSGAGSLRQAIIDANANAGADTIRFNIPLTDPNHVYYRDNGVLNSFASPVATTTADSAIADFDADYVVGTARSWYRISLSGSDLNVTGPVIVDGTS